MRTLAAAALLALTGCGSEIARTGPPSEQVRDVGTFERVVVDGRTDVRLVEGERSRVTLRGGEALVAAVESTVRDNTLSIRRDAFHDARLTVEIAGIAPRAIEGRGGADVAVAGIAGDAVALALHGPGRLRADGVVGALEATLAGTGELDLTDLAAREATVRVEGRGSARVAVADRLRAVVSGVGEIRYRGQPALERSVTGLGDVRPLR